MIKTKLPRDFEELTSVKNGSFAKDFLKKSSFIKNYCFYFYQF